MLIFIISLNEPLKALNIVDYMLNDYEGALKSNEEYNEMIEFSKNLLELSDSSIMNHSKKLYELVKNKSSVNEVKETLLKIREIILNSENFSIYPKTSISLKAGREIYLYNCAVCHGDKGDGNGPVSKNLNPKPANFLERKDLSPLRIWTVLNVGIVNMPAFNNLRDEDKWNVAFYVLSLKYQNSNVKKIKDTISLVLISKLSDNDLKDIGYSDDEIAYIRKNIEELSKRDYFSSILSNLEVIKSLYNKGEYEKAYALSVDLYFNDFEPIEKKLYGKDFSFTSKLEHKFIQLRGLVKEKNKEKDVESLILSIKDDLAKARDIIEGKLFSGNWALFNSFLIIFREGLEIAIMIGIILSIVALSQNRNAILLVHLGWISAVLLGFITWIVSNFIINISTLQRELIEGVVGFLAALILFHVSYWLISKAESKAWIGYIKEKLKSSLNKGNLVFIFSLSFLAVYREAFETVLFYQAMLLNTSKMDISYVAIGFTIGLILIFLIAYAIIKLQVKLPLNLVFPTTGSLLYLLSFIFTGQAIRSFQEANLIPTTSVKFIPMVDFLGIYPTLETLIAQSIFVVLVIFAIIFSRIQKKKEEKIIKEIKLVEYEIADILKQIDGTKDRICKFQNMILDVSDVYEKLNDALSHLKNLEDTLKQIQFEIKKQH